MFIAKNKKMKQSDIFARSFNQHDQKRFGYGALVACFVVMGYLCAVFNSYFGPLYVLNLRLMMVDEPKLAMISDITNEPKRPHVQTMETKLICNTMRKRSDTCEMSGDVRIQGNSSTIFVSTSNVTNVLWTIKPYARKGDKAAMENITPFRIIQKEAAKMPKCSITHNVPAIVFSIGGYSGNHFHSISDTIIPLYENTRKFNREVQFLAANKKSYWTSKFQDILSKLSRYEIIDIDNENEVHCFPSMIVGLKKDDRKELNIDSMNDFSMFLRSSYSLERSTAINMTKSANKRPRMLIISRKKTRAFTNVNDLVRVAQDLGFEVIVSEMSSNMTQISRLINSCDVMMGVHGAGLTNIVFLPENGVFIQVVPLGNMDWMANTFYGDPSKGMGLKYLEYKISEEESSLIDQYPRNHKVFNDSKSIFNKGWEAFRSVYMDKQNVTLDVVRFKETLSKAIELLH